MCVGGSYGLCVRVLLFGVGVGATVGKCQGPAFTWEGRLQAQLGVVGAET